MDIPAGAVTGLISRALKLVRGDPVLKAVGKLDTRIAGLEHRINRQLAAPLSHGETALEDALMTTVDAERARLIDEAIEYFRQAHHLAQGVEAARSAEYVGTSYTAKGEDKNAARWLVQARDTAIAAHDDAASHWSWPRPDLTSNISFDESMLHLSELVESEQFAERHPEMELVVDYKFGPEARCVIRRSDFFRENIFVVDSEGHAVLPLSREVEP